MSLASTLLWGQSILASWLGKPVGSLRQYRDDPNHALDWISFGL
jgi:hypothetical protein